MSFVGLFSLSIAVHYYLTDPGLNKRKIQLSKTATDKSLWQEHRNRVQAQPFIQQTPNLLALPLALYNIFVSLLFLPFPHPPLNSQSTIFIQYTDLSTPSHWKYLFSAVYHNHLNSDETNQTKLHYVDPNIIKGQNSILSCIMEIHYFWISNCSKLGMWVYPITCYLFLSIKSPSNDLSFLLYHHQIDNSEYVIFLFMKTHIERIIL